jgi:hypothetical protein
MPLPMDMKGDLKGNWKFFKSQWTNFEIATGLIRKEDAIRIATLLFVCLFVYSRTSNFSAIWQLSPLPVTGLQI